MTAERERDIAGDTDLQLSRFKAFYDELAGDSALGALSAQTNVYRRAEGRWLAATGEPVDDAMLNAQLERTMSQGSHWRPRNSRHAFFPVKHLECVVAVKFGSSPRRATQDRFAALLEKTYQHANHAFSARHDGLTGLLNKQAFQEALERALMALVVSRATIFPAPDAVQGSPSVSVLALDLDNFKQVNDTYGHLYGDLVLRCFALRLEDCLAELEKTFAGRVEIRLGRVGGEEFSILLSGVLNDTEVDEIAEECRERTARLPLPTDLEWKGLMGEAPSQDLKLPPVAERRVTISLGVASLLVAADAADVPRVALGLQSHADTALGRAKAGGRNAVRRFGDILTKHGQILEHHKEARIVAIDIGRQVNVAVGQEFIVYHPDFTGDKPFVYSDGRTRKRLGGYPRQSSGRIVVFDVQQEMSFCREVENSLDGPFPAGCSIELVPVGSIAHLIAAEAQPDGRGMRNLTPADIFAKNLEQLHAGGPEILVAVFALREVDALVEARGTFLVNQALADLYSTLLEVLPGTALISQIQPTQFAAIVDDPGRKDANQLLSQVLERAERKSVRLAKFRVGVFSVPDATEERKLPGDASKLDSRNALSYARYAVSVPDEYASPIEWFDAKTASSVVWTQRQRQKPREALADYQKLRELGIQYATLENQAALAAMQVKPVDKELAFEAIRRAMDLNPSDPFFRANLGYVEFYYGSRIEAHKVFSTLPGTFDPPEVYLVPMALSMLAQYQVDRVSVRVTELSAALKRAMELPAGILSTARRTEVQAGLDSIGEIETV